MQSGSTARCAPTSGCSTSARRGSRRRSGPGLRPGVRPRRNARRFGRPGGAGRRAALEISRRVVKWRGQNAEESIGWPLPLTRSRPPTSALPRPGARESSFSTRCSPSAPAAAPARARPHRRAGGGRRRAPSAGSRGAKKRLAEVEALARRNLRAAEEARRVVVPGTSAPRGGSVGPHRRRAHGVRRCGARSNGCGQPRSSAPRRLGSRRRTRPVRSSPTEIERVHDEHARVVDELDRMRGTLFDHDSLLDEYSRRLREEQEAQAMARASRRAPKTRNGSPNATSRSRPRPHAGAPKRTSPVSRRSKLRGATRAPNAIV